MTTAVTNRCIATLNHLYHTSSHQSSNQPDKQSSSFPTDCSTTQSRFTSHIRAQCSAFVQKVRSLPRTIGPSSDISPSRSATDDILLSFELPSLRMSSPTSCTFTTLDGQVPLAEWSNISLPLKPTFSSASSTVTLLRADRVALPDAPQIIPVTSLMPLELVAEYSKEFSPTLLRTPLEVEILNKEKPITPARILGARCEYVKLIGRCCAIRIMGFTAHPLAINGVFTVKKDDEWDRLIIDAQPANRLWKDSPYVSLPNPSHIVQLLAASGKKFSVAKSDFSNYYHHLGLLPWMCPYFALPPLTVDELASIGISDHGGRFWPMCLTVPMGFSHAVYIANACHEHVVYSSGALRRENNILNMVTPMIPPGGTCHGLIIDDFFQFGDDLHAAEQEYDAVVAAYRDSKLIVKDSKLQRPTFNPVKVIGLEICGATSVVQLSVESQLSLMQSTLSVLQRDLLTGSELAHLIGKWTWCMLVRRSSLAALQHVYRFMNVAKRRRFNIWPSVRRELWMLLGLLPLLHARLDSAFFHRLIATDASETGGGVVTAPMTGADTHSHYWPLCSTRNNAYVQAQLRDESSRTDLDAESSAAVLAYESFYTTIRTSTWSTILSTPWRHVEHINSLELRAVLLAVHWLLSYPSSLSRRVYLLVDSTVTFYSLWKGRSSSPQLLLILRKLSALLLASGVSLLPGWIPSEVNPADEPSRRYGSCVT